MRGDTEVKKKKDTVAISSTHDGFLAHSRELQFYQTIFHLTSPREISLEAAPLIQSEEDCSLC